MKIKTVIKFIIALLLCQCAGFAGSLFTTPSIPTWYATLNKPSFTPPSWIFAPVWTLLYVLMGITLFMLWQRFSHTRMTRVAITFFIIQLALNVIWSALFFGIHSPFLAFIEIIVLWLAILGTIIFSLRVSRIAGGLLIPYLLWVSFASILNFSIWQLNP